MPWRPATGRWTPSHCACATPTSGRSTSCTTARAACLHADLAAAQALADVATIALLQERTITESHTVARHLRRALDGQVAVEQAKGMLAERTGLQVGDAFELMRTHARNHNHRLVDVAEALLQGRLRTDEMTGADI